MQRPGRLNYVMLGWVRIAIFGSADHFSFTVL